MAVVNGYCSIAQLRTHFGDGGSKLTAELLERAINATSRAIDAYCGRRFWADPTVQVRAYPTDDPYEVDVHDISTTTGLIIRTDGDGDGVFETTWDAADYELEPGNADADGGAYAWWRIVAVDDKAFPVPFEGGALDSRGRLRGRQRRRRLQVTARFGWSAVPSQVEQACLLRSAALFKRKDATWGVEGFGEFGVVRIRADSDVADLLHPYMRIGAV